MAQKKCIIYVDGGICSQISQYMLGYYVKSLGYDVEYDLAWYLLDGKDLNGKKNRKFDLLKLCPDIEFKRSNLIETYFYKKKYNYVYEVVQPKNLKEKNYLGGYYDLTTEQLIEMRNIIHINPVLDYTNQLCKDKIKKTTNSVGVHVRRGDMSSDDGYWRVTSTTYYINALNQFIDSTFFFFSDDMEWVKNNIVSKIPDLHYELVEYNSDEKGYLDLALLVECQNFICSAGSLGKIAALLSNNREKKIILPQGTNQLWLDAFGDNALMLLDGK